MKRLHALKVLEVPGVDRPATELDGFLVAKAARAENAQAVQEFAKLLRELRGAGDAEGIQKAINLCPPHIAGPALDQVLMADKIREQYGLTKEKHSLRDLATGQFAPAATAEQAPECKSLFRHFGNVLPALRGGA